MRSVDVLVTIYEYIMRDRSKLSKVLHLEELA